MTPQETFITRLRRHRERNRISLDDIVSQTRIKREQLEAFENGDLAVWPRGIYARAWIREYAGIVGLDPSDTVDEFCRLFPHGDRRAAQTFRDFAAIVAHDSAYQDQLDGTRPDRRRRAGDEGVPEPPPKTPATWREQLLRVFRTLRNPRAPFATHVPYDR